MYRTCSDVLHSPKYTEEKAANEGSGIRGVGEVERVSHRVKNCRPETGNHAIMSSCIVAKKQSLAQTFIFSNLNYWNNFVVDLQVSECPLSYPYPILLQICFSSNTLLTVLFPSNKRRKIKSLQPIPGINIEFPFLWSIFHILVLFYLSYLIPLVFSIYS